MRCARSDTNVTEKVRLGKRNQGQCRIEQGQGANNEEMDSIGMQRRLGWHLMK